MFWTYYLLASLSLAILHAILFYESNTYVILLGSTIFWAIFKIIFRGFTLGNMYGIYHFLNLFSLIFWWSSIYLTYVSIYERQSFLWRVVSGFNNIILFVPCQYKEKMWWSFLIFMTQLWDSIFVNTHLFALNAHEWGNKNNFPGLYRAIQEATVDTDTIIQ